MKAIAATLLGDWEDERAAIEASLFEEAMEASLLGKSAIEASSLEEAIKATLLEDENTQIENGNAGRLVAEYIQKHADVYHGVFNPPHDGNCIVAVANDGVNVAWLCSALHNMVLRYMTSNGTELQYITLR